MDAKNSFGFRKIASRFPTKKEHIVLTKSPVERLPTKKYSEPSYPIASMYAMFEVHIYIYIVS